MHPNPTADAPSRGPSADKMVQDYLLLMDYVLSGYTIKDLSGLSSEHMEAVYTLAYNLYNAGKYQDAETLFRFLCLNEHTEKRFWMGLGACRKMLKKFEASVEAYFMASCLDSDDPTPPLHAADCHIALGNLSRAKDALGACIEYSGAGKGYDSVREHAKGILALIQTKERHHAASGRA